MISDIVNTESGYEDAVKTIEEHISNIEKKTRILIKVDLNAGRKSLESGAVTNIELVEKIIETLNRKVNPKEIIIAESGNIISATEAFELQGYSELEKKYKNVHLLDLDEASKIKIQNDAFRILKSTMVSEEIVLCDYFINVANFKRHLSERVAGCCINLYNCISDRQNRMRYLPICGCVARDVANAVKPFLNILDCSVVLQGLGPVEGEPKRIGRLVVSDDPFLADSLACKLIGETPSKVPQLKHHYRKFSKIICATELVKKAEFIDRLSYFLIRISMFLKKIGLYFDNLSHLIFLVSFIFISMGPRKLLRGRWMPFNEYFKIAKTVYMKFEEPSNLLNWKITINKHVEQESIS